MFQASPPFGTTSVVLEWRGYFYEGNMENKEVIQLNMPDFLLAFTKEELKEFGDWWYLHFGGFVNISPKIIECLIKAYELKEH
jgi:hypothetical protein